MYDDSLTEKVQDEIKDKETMKHMLNIIKFDND